MDVLGGRFLLASWTSNSATLAYNCRSKSVNSSPVRVSKDFICQFAFRPLIHYLLKLHLSALVAAKHGENALWSYS